MKAPFTYILFLFLFVSGILKSQTATISGVVKDVDGEPLPDVSVAVKENIKHITASDKNGAYTLTIESGKNLTIVFYSSSYDQITYTITAKPGQELTYSPRLKFKNTLVEVEVTDIKKRSQEVIIIDPKVYSQLPTLTFNVEDIIKTQIGVSSNNELSSGYSVRGGNFDENLVYVNDIEVYRPFLVRSGQQEGFSFANPYMVQNINFSAGGFEAKYGDKLSSVLDITYRKPLKFEGNASGSVLGGNIQLEGISKNRLVAWSIGSRYRTNSYLLKTLDTKGEYRPSAFDVQTFLTFDVNPKLKIEFLGNIANNKYLVVPSNRQTNFGTVNNALRFTVFFDGQELMQYTTMMGGLSTTYRPNSKTKLKFITSAYRANEEEIYTVQGQYYIDQLEADLGKPNFGQVAFNRGVGTFINNGRNYLTATVFNVEHKGTRYINENNTLLWGARCQAEQINDKLSEWRMVDSAGYIIPNDPNQIDLQDVYKTKINLPSTRSQAYLQYNINKLLKDSSNLNITAGVRGNYWTVNKQFIFSPRFTIAFKPNWKNNWLFKLSGGFYYQPPFYRELRNINGEINKNVKAQQSIHAVLSSDYIFQMWGRPFKLIMAGYYKQLNNLIPYEIDNVRVRYFANNNANGFATGMDFRINGEFVKGVESWASMGFLRTYERSADNIHYTYYNAAQEEIIKGYTFDQVKTDSVKVDPGYIPRPTDQLVTFGLFFQDYLPKLPACKFNLNLQFGSGLPFGPPTHLRWQQVLRMPPYRRVDAGFAYNIIKENREIKQKNVFNHLREMWIFIEVYNLLQVQNTVSFTWIQDVTGNRYAIPNYLTNRQLNLRLQIKF
ncbi:MAG: TonB-linked outer membrane protein SusC/RagA family [Bacteroidetes bacterium]|nr:TonB-linked outer membrane protein SusC/RagA family [Bacteroidota bacterium]